MSYCNVRIKSTVKEGRNYARMESEGSVNSNDLEAARRASVDLGHSLEISNRKAYECHVRSRG